MTVKEYRAKHKRCRTCIYAAQSMYIWTCKAKGIRHCGSVGNTTLAGMFCKVYEPLEGV